MAETKKKIVGKLDGIPIVEGDMNEVGDNEYYLYRGQDLTLYKRNQQNRGINILDFPKTDCWVSLASGKNTGSATGPSHIQGSTYMGESAPSITEVPIKKLSGFKTSGYLSLFCTGNQIPDLDSASKPKIEDVAIPPKNYPWIIDPNGGITQTILSIDENNNMKIGMGFLPSINSWDTTHVPWLSWPYAIDARVTSDGVLLLYTVSPRIAQVVISATMGTVDISLAALLLKVFRGGFKNVKAVVFYDPEKYPNGYLNALEEQFKEQSK